MSYHSRAIEGHGRPDLALTVLFRSFELSHWQWAWLATLGGGDGFCGTGDTPQDALRDLADAMDAHAIRCGLRDTLQEAERRAGVGVKPQLDGGS